MITQFVDPVIPDLFYCSTNTRSEGRKTEDAGISGQISENVNSKQRRNHTVTVILIPNLVQPTLEEKKGKACR